VVGEVTRWFLHPEIRHDNEEDLTPAAFQRLLLILDDRPTAVQGDSVRVLVEGGDLALLVGGQSGPSLAASILARRQACDLGRCAVGLERLVGGGRLCYK
jgi:hypothetical protein